MELTFEQAKKIILGHKKWYSKRARRDYVYVFPNEPFMRDYPKKATKLMDSQTPCDFVNLVVNGEVQLCHPTNVVSEAAEAYFNKIRKDKRLLTSLENEFKRNIELFKIVSKKLDLEIKRENLDKISENYLEVVNLTINLTPEGLFFWFLLEFPLNDFIKASLLKQVPEKEVNELLAILSQSPKPTVFYQAREQLLNFLKEIPSEDLDIIKNSNNALEILKRSPLNKKFEGYIKEYEWIPFEYVGPTILDWDYLTREIKEILNAGLEKEIKKQEQFKNLKSKQEELFEKYQIKGEIKDLILLLQEFNEFFDYRKRAFSEISLKFSKFYEKISKFYNLKDYRDLYWLTPEEHMELIKTGKINLDIIKERKKSVIILFSEEGHGIFQGKQSDELISYVIPKDIQENRIKGNIASVANLKTLKGKARVLLNPSECHLMKEGEILVAQMTSPPYMLAIHKAIAIVTDEGGVLCHAAIVSRELNVPCIVGARIATKKIKTGDEIELNLETGEIKIL